MTLRNLLVKSLVSRLDKRLSGAASAIQRYFTSLDGIMQSYTFTTPVVLAGDFEIEIDFTYSLDRMTILSHGVNNELTLEHVSSRLALRVSGGFASVPITSANYTAGVLYRLVMTRAGGQITFNLNGETPVVSRVGTFTISKVGVKNTSSQYFNGYLANLKITDGTTPVVDAKLDEDFATTTIAVNTANPSNNLTTNNIVASELFTFSPPSTWNGAGGSTIEVAP